jgi:hypothetical protein
VVIVPLVRPATVITIILLLLMLGVAAVSFVIRLQAV